jgi:hypothetical protein
MASEVCLFLRVFDRDVGVRDPDIRSRSSDIRAGVAVCASLPRSKELLADG